jgi:hypothetical protein
MDPQISAAPPHGGDIPAISCAFMAYLSDSRSGNHKDVTFDGDFGVHARPGGRNDQQSSVLIASP